MPISVHYHYAEGLYYIAKLYKVVLLSAFGGSIARNHWLISSHRGGADIILAVVNSYFVFRNLFLKVNHGHRHLII